MYGKLFENKKLNACIFVYYLFLYKLKNMYLFLINR